MATLAHDISAHSGPICTNILPFDSSSHGESNGGIFVQIGPLCVEICLKLLKVTQNTYVHT